MGVGIHHDATTSRIFARIAKANRVRRGEPIRVFIGSGEASVIEREVLIYSFFKHTQRPLDIRVFNGTHNSLEHAGGIDPIPLTLPLKYRMGHTEFGLYRFFVPQLCGHSGRAIYLDSDIICLGDIAELFDRPFDGADCLAVPYPKASGETWWRASVMLMECARITFDLSTIFAAIDEGQFEEVEMYRMSPRFLARYPHQIGALETAWNDHDHYDANTKLLHFTNMYTQPWKHTGHPHAGLWFRYFREAIADGWVSEDDIELSIRRNYTRSALNHGFSPRRFVVRTRLGQMLKAWKAKLAAEPGR